MKMTGKRYIEEEYFLHEEGYKIRRREISDSDGDEWVVWDGLDTNDVWDRLPDEVSATLEHSIHTVGYEPMDACDVPVAERSPSTPTEDTNDAQEARSE